MDKLKNIIKYAYDKYGKQHLLSIVTANSLDGFIKTSFKESDEILEQSISIDIEELESLFNPKKFEFPKQTIGLISLEP